MADFHDMIAQPGLRDHLKTAIEKDMISHAYIICGDRGTGKEFAASIFAKALQCEKHIPQNTDIEAVPCNVCHSCVQADSGSHPDIIYVAHEKPGSIGVDDIRIQINSDMGIKPYQGRYKIYIVRDAELMTVQAQNALLKTIEEPPEYGIILLLANNIETLLPTILSRCVILNMRVVPDEVIRTYLMEEIKVPDYRAQVCAAFARGNIGRAKNLASSEEFDRIKEEAISLLKYINDMEIADIMTEIKKINELKMDITDFLDMIAIWYRDVLLFKATNDMNDLIFKNEIKYIKKVASSYTFEGIQNIIEALDKAKKRLRANVNFDLTMELLLMTIRDA